MASLGSVSAVSDLITVLSDTNSDDKTDKISQAGMNAKFFAMRSSLVSLLHHLVPTNAD